jgi:hypothetical protein
MASLVVGHLSRLALRGMLATFAMCSPAWAAKPDVRGLTEWTTPSLTIYAHDAAKVRAIVRCASFGEHLLYRLFKREPRANGIPTYVIIPRGSVWNRYLRPGKSLDGEYVPTRFANYVVMSNWLTDGDLAYEAYWQFTHVFLRNEFAGHVPLWFDDGLASLISNWRAEGNVVRIGEKTWGTSDLFRPTAQVLRMERHSPEYLRRQSGWFRWQAKMIVHKALFDDVEFGRKTRAYLAALNDGLDIDAAVQRAYGHGVEELHQTLNKYSNQFYVKVTEIPVDWKTPALPVQGRELDEFEALELLANVMLVTGFNPMRLEEVIAAASRLQPNSPRTLMLNLRLAVRNQDDTGIEALLSRLNPLSDDPRVARQLGVALFERIHEPRPDDALSDEMRMRLANRAFGLLQASERTLPVDAEAAWVFGQLADRLDRETAFALQRLGLAQVMLPRQADLSEVSARLMKKLGQQDAMVTQLRATLRHARTIPQIRCAKEQLSAHGVPSPPEN